VLEEYNQRKASEEQEKIQEEASEPSWAQDLE
jgi:hypothetical protein